MAGWDAGHTLWQRDKELWLFPLALEPLFGKVRFSRIGVRWRNCTIRGTAGSMRRLSPCRAAARLELSQEEAEEWYRGRDVYPQTALGRMKPLSPSRRSAGLAKRVGSRLKNSYPRELVRDGKLCRQGVRPRKNAHFLTGALPH